MRNLTFLILCITLAFASCSNDERNEAEAYQGKMLSLTVQMPQSASSVSLKTTPLQKEDSKDIQIIWKSGDKIKLFFRQNGNLYAGSESTVQSISADGKSAEFQVTLPSGITGGTFDLYAVNGADAIISNGALLLDASPSASFTNLNDAIIPVYLKMEGIDANTTSISGQFVHYGALQVLTVKNTGNASITLSSAALSSSCSDWFYKPDGSGNTPAYNLLTGTTSLQAISFSNSTTPVTYTVAPGSNLKLAQWVVPNGTTPPAINLTATIGGNSKTSTTQKPARTSTLTAGNSYHLYAIWDGTNLTFSDATTIAPDGIMTITTTKNLNSSITLNFEADAANQAGVWIDLNGNGLMDTGEKVTTFATDASYTIQAQTIRIYGKITTFECHDSNLTTLDVSKNTYLTNLDCSRNALTSLNVSQNTALEGLSCSSNLFTALSVSSNTLLGYLDCSNNQLTALNLPASNTVLGVLTCFNNRLSGSAMGTVINRLPSGGGQLYVIDLSSVTEQNICTQAQVQEAASKQWQVLDKNANPYNGS